MDTNVPLADRLHAENEKNVLNLGIFYLFLVQYGV